VLLPALRENGVDDAVIERVFVELPAAFLTLQPKN